MAHRRGVTDEPRVQAKAAETDLRDATALNRRAPISQSGQFRVITTRMENSPIDRLPPPFDEVMRLYEREIMRFLLRTTHDREDALDLFQETWLRAYRAYAKLDGRNGIRPWLYRIATNLCLNRARDRARHSRVIFDSELADVSDHAAPDGGHDRLLQLKATMERLPRKQREAVMMRKFAGLEYDEIATALGCSLEAARADVYQAMKKIRLAE